MPDIANILNNNGMGTAFSGIMVVFSGLILIALVIVAFNWLFSKPVSERKLPTFKLPPEEPDDESVDTAEKDTAIPDDHRIAIATAIELYRRIHFDMLQSEMKFVRGNDAQNAWKMGRKFGQRIN